MTRQDRERRAAEAARAGEVAWAGQAWFTLHVLAHAGGVPADVRQELLTTLRAAPPTVAAVGSRVLRSAQERNRS